MDQKPRPWDYNVEKMARWLEAIKERYFRPVIAYPEGHLCHHAHCETHRAMEVYKYAPCGCGLLHDLLWIEHTVALKIFPQMDEDYAKQEAMVPGHRYWLGPISDDELAKYQAILDEAFPVKISPTADEAKELEKRDWTVIEKVFGKPFTERMQQSWEEIK